MQTNFQINAKKYSTLLFSGILFLMYTNAFAQWVPQGPAPKLNGQTEGITDGPVSGAINCVAPHPNDSDELYIGATNGGVWRTTNATNASPSWTFLTADLPCQAVGALEYDPTDGNFNTIVMGNGYTSSLGSTGSGPRSIYKTTNGLAPWTHIDPNNQLPVDDITGVAPRGNTIVVSMDGSTNGIFRTEDNGSSWIQISGLGGSGLPVGETDDLVSDPNDNTVLYTVVDNDGVFKSVDTGENWDRVSNATIENLLAGASMARMSVGAHNNVFIGIVNSTGLAGVFRSGNGGSTWTALDLPSTIEEGVATGLLNGSGTTKLFSITADPSNSNLVYVGGKAQPGPLPNSLGANNYTGRLFRIDASLPAGSQASPITHTGTSNDSSPHADSRDMDFDADGDLIEGDDGGVFTQTSPQNGTGDWFALNGNLNITEAHNMSLDQLSGLMMIGTQDNGNISQVAMGNLSWNNVTNGDGGDIAIGSVDGILSTRYTSAHRFGNFRRRLYDSNGNFQSGSVQIPGLFDVNNNSSIESIDSFGFVTPFSINSQDANRLLIGSRSQIYESFDEGNTVASILVGEVNASTNFGRQVLIYGADDNADVIYAGIGSAVQIRTVANGAFSPANGYGGGTVMGIALNPSNSQNAFVIDADEIFVTSNGGNNFDNITGNFNASNMGDLLSIVYMPDDLVDRVAVGTEYGVFFASAPDFDFWVELDTNIPQVRIEELEYDESEKTLAASTLGRGTWTYTFEERDPVDLGLVLDFSGSMLSEACPGCDPKIDVLKEAVEIFLQIWKLLAVPDDEVTTVYFRTNVDELSIGGTSNLNVIDRTDAIINDVNSQVTDYDELTALGGGIQTGIVELTNVLRPRHVIVFTDGMQNVDPGITYPDLEILDGEFQDNSNVNEANPPMDLNNIGPLKVHTIGVGASSAFETQLRDISNATNGLTRITTDAEDDLIQFYLEDLVEILRDNSPQLITYRKEAFNTSAQETVLINQSVSQVLFKVSYPVGSPINISIFKDGVNVTSLAHHEPGDFYDIYHFTFDQLAQVMAGATTNEWNVRMTSSMVPSQPYQLAVIVDEIELKYNLGILKPNIQSGDPGQIFAEFDFDGFDFDGDAEITAVVKSPRFSFANLLSEYKLPQKGLKLEKGMLVGERKFAYLMQDKKYSKYFEHKMVEMPMKKVSNKRFRLDFKDTRLTGTYCVQFLIKIKDKNRGYFERVETRNFIVEFGKLDRKASKMKLERKRKNRWSLVIKPVDENKNLLGPDQLKNLKFNIEGGELVKENDPGDGSYEYIFTANDSKSKIQLKYKDRVWIKWRALDEE